ncbi:head GIN domain-containing protein [Microscilla marina]|uniref:head GIN domain-containing protein n=1 Tax=Microscilla marina TaxID=1027 RepID=UPI0005D47CBB|nr:head GIN domain-containing protein [Microscilla marina]
MRLSTILTSLCLLVVISACNTTTRGKDPGYDDDGKVYTGEDTFVEEAPPLSKNNDYGKVRNLPEFNSLLHSIAGDVIWKQGDKQSVEVHAVPDVLREIVTEVKEGGLLYIGYRTHGFRQGDNKVYVFITTPSIKAIRLSASGNLKSKNRWEVSDLSLAVSGSGNFNIRLDAKKVMTEVKGSGNVKLRGNTDLHTINLMGSGQVLCQSLDTDVCQVEVNGSGVCQLNVNDELNATVNGSGSITYKGNPTVRKSVNGSGSISQR